MATESFKEISFTVARHDEHAVKLNKLASTVTFKLGLGPCGRFVESLESSIDYHGVTIKQVSYPDDYGHVKESWKRLRERNKTDWENATGFVGDGIGRTSGWGWGNLKAMTPTKEEYTANCATASEFQKKYMALHDQREIKEFFYKLEDVRGRIVVIR